MHLYKIINSCVANELKCTRLSAVIVKYLTSCVFLNIHFERNDHNFLFLNACCRNAPSKRSQKVSQRMNLSLNLVRKKMNLKMVKKIYFTGVKRTYMYKE